MSALKNRTTALVLTIIIIALSTLLGVSKSLNSLSKDIEDMFVSGVYLKGEGYRQAGIDAHLSSISAAAMNTASITSNYPELSDKTDSLRKSRAALVDAKTIKDKFKARTELDVTYNMLYSASEQTEMSQRDRDALTEYNRTYTGASAAIETSAYNEEVRSFVTGEAYSPIAGILKPIAFVKDPQSFGG